jgi:hypothetical protein
MDLVRTLKYIEAEAIAGHFAQPTDVLVLTYLWFNTWRKPAKDSNRPGKVLDGKAPLDQIAGGTGMSVSGAKKALRRLRTGGWVSTFQTSYVAGTGREGWKSTNEIFVLMDVPHHRERAEIRATGTTEQEAQERRAQFKQIV